MNKPHVFRVFGLMTLGVSLPFAIIHLRAAPDDAPITLVQRFAAVLANGCGPWGVAMVRLVNFPNAGWRSFSWALAIGLTLAGVGLCLLRLRSRGPVESRLWTVTWGVFLVIWFGVGLAQIADGLL